jgi:hypothetical protein
MRNDSHSVLAALRSTVYHNNLFPCKLKRIFLQCKQLQTWSETNEHFHENWILKGGSKPLKGTSHHNAKVLQELIL